jgi:hypothetical protein
VIRRIFVGIIVGLVGFLCVPVGAHAQTPPKNKGLLVTPVRQYVDVTAGVPKDGSVTIGNFTDKPITVVLSVEQFSVSDYAYEYLLKSAKTNMVQLGTTSVVLQKNENKKIPFTVLAPLATVPGGHYYTILASASITQGGVDSKVQAGSPLYITVDGTHIKTNQLAGGSVQKFNVGSSIPFSLDIKNTGNTHYFVYTTGILSGFLAEQSVSSTSHILLPNTTRRLEGSIPAPLLPGVYKVTYGYKLEDKALVALESYVIYTPLWFYVVLIVLGWFGLRFVRNRRKQKVNKTETPAKPGLE